MIVVTGAAGFIGSNTVAHLSEQGHDIVAVVDMDEGLKWKNLWNKPVADTIDKEEFLAMVVEKRLPFLPTSIVHMGANSSTTTTDCKHLLENNFRYSKILATYAVQNEVRFIYASSAATYGNGDQGFSDSEEANLSLRPINAYGFSKWMFDQWAIRHKLLNRIVGLRFFNVYGPNEYHKLGQSSPVGVFLSQLLDRGTIRLFASLHPDFENGKQQRDFVYVKDCCKIIDWLLKNLDANGIFNVGTGTARTWIDMAQAIAKAVDKECNIEFVDLPEKLRDQYQYFTEADVTRLRAAGYLDEMTPLEEGVADYIKSYLLKNEYR
jgi:ADP-L-glycero-D-manno-heptose 6-epimerase